MPSKLTQNDLEMQLSAQGLEEQIALLGTLPEETTKELKGAMKGANQLMKSDVVPRVKTFSGSTARSVTSVVRVGVEGQVTGITGPSDKGKNARAHIFRFMQDGTYWQNESNTQPWVYDLLDWVKAKFHPPEGKEIQAAYALARSIKQKGTKGTPIARPVMEGNRSSVLALLKAAIDKAVEKMKVNNG